MSAKCSAVKLTKLSILCVMLVASLLGGALPTSAASGPPAGPSNPPTPANLVLWNRFESEQDVLTSEVGPDVQLINYIYQNWDEAMIAPAQFGNGLFVNHDTGEGWNNDGANFFAVDISQTTLSPEQGTIEFWFKFKYDSSAFNHAYFFLTGARLEGHHPGYWSDCPYFENMVLTAGWNGWDYGSYGKRFFFDIAWPSQNTSIYLTTPNYSAAPGGSLQFTDDTMMHFGFVWNVNGIDSTQDTMRIYVDGNLAAASQQTWPTTVGFDPYLYIGSQSNCDPWDTFYNAVKGVTDNLVIWNYAKTDFSGRLIEDPIPNQPPDCSLALPSVNTLWPPNNKFVPITVQDIADPDGDPVAITVNTIRQDEPVGRGNSAPDGKGVGAAIAELRAERLGNGNGRVYRIGFTASDDQGGSCTGLVAIGVPHDQAKPVGDGGPLYDSTIPSP